MIKTLKISMLFVGTVVGAGFASGQEIFRYFVVYGKWSIFALILACFILCTIGYLSLKLGKTSENVFCKLTVNIFIIISYIAMLSACGALFNSLFGVPYFIGVIMLSVCSFYTIIGGENRIMNVNLLLVPIIVITIIFAFFLSKPQNPVFFENDLGIINSAIIYIGYNSIIIIPLMHSINKNDVNIKISFLIAFFILAALGIMMWVFMNYYNGGQIPILNVINSNIKKIYGFVILICIYTTAVSDCFTFKKVAGDKVNLLVIVGIVAGNIRLDWIVKNLYLLIGIFGIITTMIFFDENLKRSKTKIKDENKRNIKNISCN